MTRSSRTALAAAVALAALAACDRPSPLPQLSVSTTQVVFDAGRSGDPAPQSITVVNSGGGTLDAPAVEVAYQEGTGWLPVEVVGATAPYVISLRPLAATLQPGTYRATLTISCANASASPVTVQVTMTVPGPSYQPSTTALAFTAPASGDPEPLTFEVTNVGRGSLPMPEVEVSYAGSAATGWLSAAVSGTSDPYTVTVTAHEVAGLASGIHAAALTVGSPVLGGIRRVVPVTFTLAPQLVVSGSVVPFVPARGDTSPLTQVFTVRNAGRGRLPPPTITATSVGSWLSAKVFGSADPYTVAVTADRWRELAAGDYTGSLTLSSPGAPTSPTTEVSLRVGPAAMTVSGDVSWSVYGGCPLPGEQAVTVTNTGIGFLAPPAVTISTDAAPWLDAEVVGSQAPYRVVFSAIARPAGATGASASTVAVLQAPGATAVEVPVSYTSLVPAITGSRASPSAVVIHGQAGTGDPAPAILSVRTDGGCIPAPAVSYAYGPTEPEWLSWSVRTVPQRHDVTLRASTAGMSPGGLRKLSLYVSSVRAGENTPVFSATVPLTVENATIEPTGALSTARFWHAAVALPDGRMLVTGGEDSSGAIPVGNYSRVVPSAEVYDPATGRFEAFPSLVQARSRHGALTLDDGRVVVCGGWSGAEDLRTCEVSAGGAWTTFATLQRPHDSPALVQAGGRLIVAGMGGAYAQASDAVEVVELATGAAAFATGADGSEQVRGTAAVALADGTILVAGTEGGATWRYDPAANVWTRTGAMHASRREPALLRLPDGRVLAVDGLGTDASDTRARADRGAEIWDPRTGAWTRAAGATYRHVAGDLVTLGNGKVVAFNGERTLDFATTEIELFDPDTGAWSIVQGTSIPAPSLGARVVRLADGTILVAGGRASYGASMAKVFRW